MSEKDKYPSEAAERFQIRLPGGLRDRIKAYAERHGRSMNTEIVRVLELEFPEQWTVEDRLNELGEMLSVLAAGRKDPRFVAFSEKVEETITGIMSGRVMGVAPETRDAVESMWHDFKMRESEAAMDHAEDHYWGRTDEEIEAHRITGNFEKYPVPLPRPADPARDNFYLMDILPPDALAEFTKKVAQTDVEGAVEVLRSIPKEEIEKRIEFQKLPLLEQYRLRGEEPPATPGEDPFAFTESEKE